MNRGYVLALAALLSHAFVAPACAQRVGDDPANYFGGAEQAAVSPTVEKKNGIAAVVNDGIISTADVDARIKLAALSSGLKNVPEVRKRLFPQVMHALIDEQLQIQEGKRLDINVTQDELKKALEKLALSNNIPGGDMGAFIEAQGVPSSTLTEQVKAALTWNKVVQRVLRPRIDIGDDEVDAAIERIRANAGKQEYLVSEIYLSVDKTEDEERVKQFAEELVQQVKSGASFGNMARQFSQGTGASNGGDVGWIQIGQMAPEIDKILQNMQQGEVAGPVRTSAGFHIIGVREKRTIAAGDAKEMTVALQQAFRPFSESTSKELLLKEAEKLRQIVSSCDGLQEKLKKNFSDWRWQDLGEVKLADAPEWLANKVRDIAVGHASDAMATDKGALILFVCERKMPDNINRGEIMNSIGIERIELLARRYLRDLKRNAHMDVRMSSLPE